MWRVIDCGLALSFVAAIVLRPGPAQASSLPEPLSSPDAGVVCNASEQACYDRLGPSIGLTQAFLGPEAAQRWTERSRSAAAGEWFSLAKGVRCRRERGPCEVDGATDAALTAILYDPPRRPSGETAERRAILDADWEWVETRYGNDSEVRPSDPARYRVRFASDGALVIRADCNQAGGKYRIDGSSLSLGPLHATMAACGADSLADVFLRDLQAAGILFLEEGELFLDLPFDTGTMRLRRAVRAESQEDS